MPNGDHSDHEILLRPDGRVAAIGFKTFQPGQYGRMLEVYDATTGRWQLGAESRDAWRRLASIEIAREYHAMPVVLPDGRIFVAGGEGEPGNEPARSIAEAFTPPYLLRGPRPGVAAVVEPELRRGAPVTLDLAQDELVTEVVILGTNATTHFMESGTGRYLSLPFQQDGRRITAQVPADAARQLTL